MATNQPIEDAGKRIISISERRKGKSKTAEPEWVATASGGGFDLCAENPAQVKIRDIAHQLAIINRWNGATKAPYSVAQHSVLVSQVLKAHHPIIQLMGLLHDAHEIYIGDTVRPVKTVTNSIDAYSARDDLADTIQRTIHRALRIPEPTKAIRALVDAADDAVLATEVRDILAQHTRDFCLKAAPLRTPINPWNWTRAEARFLERYDELSTLAATQIGVA